jgi:outer membrane protein W
MIRTFAGFFGAAILLSGVVASQEAIAQSTSYGPANVGKFYGGISGGVIIPDKLHGTFSGGIVGSGDLSFKVGPAGSGLFGYYLNDYLALEGQVAYAAFDEDNFAGTLNGITSSAPIKGQVTTVLGVGNVIFKPFGRSGFSPYVGAGAGYGYFYEKVDSIGGIAVGSRSTDSGLAADGILGFDVAIARQWSLGARYQFVWVNISSSTTSNGVTTKQDNFTAHVIGATATFHF